jgi:predicted transcriptional regulator
MVKRVLPSIRAEITREMVLEHGMLKQDVAKVLGVSNAAVSQYLSSKRGAEADFSEEVKNEISNFVALMCNGEGTPQVNQSFCPLCKLIQTKGWLHRQQGDSSYCQL